MKHGPGDSVPPELSSVEGFDELRLRINETKDVLSAFAGGNFDYEFQLKGSLAGYIKAIQANIRHLAWMWQSVSDGDFSLRVDFMGSLSEAFNAVTTRLAEKHEEVQQKQAELVALTEELKSEILKKEKMAEALRASEEMYREKALRDPLTGLYNRGYFFETAAREMENLKRQKNGCLCVVMMDIDHFKKFNDTYGHLCGDEAIKMVANCLMMGNTLRQSDIFARYGGEEFSIMLLGSDLNMGMTIADRIRVKVASQSHPAPESVGPITVSIGISEVNGAKLNCTRSGREILIEALDRADSALYEAKNKGRNMVQAYIGNIPGPENPYLAP